MFKYANYLRFVEIIEYNDEANKIWMSSHIQIKISKIMCTLGLALTILIARLLCMLAICTRLMKNIGCMSTYFIGSVGIFLIDQDKYKRYMLMA